MLRTVRSSSTKTKVCTEFKALCVPVVRFQTRPKWIASMTIQEPCLKHLQFLKAKAITRKENNAFRGIMCAYECLLWPFSKFSHQGLWELAGLSNPGDYSFHFIKTWAIKKKTASADDDSRGWQGWEPNIHFPGWWRASKCGSKTKWGRSETLSNLTWWHPSKTRRCHGKCWVAALPKGNLRRRKEKSSPLIKVGGGDMGKARNSWREQRG